MNFFEELGCLMLNRDLSPKQPAIFAEYMLDRMMPVDQWIASLNQEKKEMLVRVLRKPLKKIHKDHVEAIKREISDPSPTWVKGHRKIPGSARFGY